MLYLGELGMQSSFKIMKYDPGSSWPNLGAFEVAKHSLRSLPDFPMSFG